MSGFCCCARMIKFKKINNNNVLPHKMSSFCCAGITKITKNNNNHNLSMLALLRVLFETKLRNNHKQHHKQFQCTIQFNNSRVNTCSQNMEYSIKMIKY